MNCKEISTIPLDENIVLNDLKNLDFMIDESSNEYFMGSISKLSLIPLSSVTDLSHSTCSINQCFTESIINKTVDIISNKLLNELKVKHINCDNRIVEILSKLDSDVNTSIEPSKINLNDVQFENGFHIGFYTYLMRDDKEAIIMSFSSISNVEIVEIGLKDNSIFLSVNKKVLKFEEMKINKSKWYKIDVFVNVSNIVLVVNCKEKYSVTNNILLNWKGLNSMKMICIGDGNICYSGLIADFVLHGYHLKNSNELCSLMICLDEFLQSFSSTMFPRKVDIVTSKSIINDLTTNLESETIKTTKISESTTIPIQYTSELRVDNYEYSDLIQTLDQDYLKLFSTKLLRCQSQNIIILSRSQTNIQQIFQPIKIQPRSFISNQGFIIEFYMILPNELPSTSELNEEIIFRLYSNNKKKILIIQLMKFSYFRIQLIDKSNFKEWIFEEHQVMKKKWNKIEFQLSNSEINLRMNCKEISTIPLDENIVLNDLKNLDFMIDESSNEYFMGSISKLSLIPLSSVTDLSHSTCSINQCFTESIINKTVDIISNQLLNELKVKHINCDNRIVEILSKLDSDVNTSIEPSKINLNDVQFENGFHIGFYIYLMSNDDSTMISFSILNENSVKIGLKDNSMYLFLKNNGFENVFEFQEEKLLTSKWYKIDIYLNSTSIVIEINCGPRYARIHNGFSKWKQLEFLKMICASTDLPCFSGLIASTTINSILTGNSLDKCEALYCLEKLFVIPESVSSIKPIIDLKTTVLNAGKISSTSTISSSFAKSSTNIKTASQTVSKMKIKPSTRYIIKDLFTMAPVIEYNVAFLMNNNHFQQFNRQFIRCQSENLLILTRNNYLSDTRILPISLGNQKYFPPEGFILQFYLWAEYDQNDAIESQTILHLHSIKQDNYLLIKLLNGYILAMEVFMSNNPIHLPLRQIKIVNNKWNKINIQISQTEIVFQVNCNKIQSISNEQLIDWSSFEQLHILYEPQTLTTFESKISEMKIISLTKQTNLNNRNCIFNICFTNERIADLMKDKKFYNILTEELLKQFKVQYFKCENRFLEIFRLNPDLEINEYVYQKIDLSIIDFNEGLQLEFYIKPEMGLNGLIFSIESEEIKLNIIIQKYLIVKIKDSQNDMEYPFKTVKINKLKWNKLILIINMDKISLNHNCESYQEYHNNGFTKWKDINKLYILNNNEEINSFQGEMAEPVISGYNPNNSTCSINYCLFQEEFQSLTTTNIFPEMKISTSTIKPKMSTKSDKLFINSTKVETTFVKLLTSSRIPSFSVSTTSLTPAITTTPIPSFSVSTTLITPATTTPIPPFTVSKTTLTPAITTASIPSFSVSTTSLTPAITTPIPSFSVSTTSLTPIKTTTQLKTARSALTSQIGIIPLKKAEIAPFLLADSQLEYLTTNSYICESESLLILSRNEILIDQSAEQVIIDTEQSMSIEGFILEFYLFITPESFINKDNVFILSLSSRLSEESTFSIHIIRGNIINLSTIHSSFPTEMLFSKINLPVSKWTKLSIKISLMEISLTVNCNYTQTFSNEAISNWLMLSQMNLLTDPNNFHFSGFITNIFISALSVETDKNECSILNCLLNNFKNNIVPVQVKSGFLSEYSVAFHEPKLQLDYIKCENKNILSVLMATSGSTNNLNPIPFQINTITGIHISLYINLARTSSVATSENPLLSLYNSNKKFSVIIELERNSLIMIVTEDDQIFNSRFNVSFIKNGWNKIDIAIFPEKIESKINCKEKMLDNSVNIKSLKKLSKVILLSHLWNEKSFNDAQLALLKILPISENLEKCDIEDCLLTQGVMKTTVEIQASTTSYSTAKSEFSSVTTAQTIQQRNAWKVGEKGDSGEKGLSGAKGEKGDRGFRGLSGKNGLLGPSVKGEPGVQGSQGIPGNKGEKGNPGMNGKPGWQGFAGMIGQKGDKGINGRNGDKGEIGRQGFRGLIGPMGNPGKAGKPGSIGIQGHPGIKGSKGNNGLKGPLGLTGQSGKGGVKGTKGSKGFVGSKGKANILPGLQGSIGLPGNEGNNGDIGKKGEKGFSGKLGEKGDPGKPGLDGKEGIKGKTGLVGLMGLKGTPGKSGINGLAGQKGIAGIDGEPGDLGEPGLQGQIGPTGESGLKGDVGKDGIDGPPGTKGADGPPGTSLPGIKGITGIMGIPGESGEKGSSGSKGETGSPGPSGEKGIKGEVGEKGETLNGTIGKMGSLGELGPKGLEGIRGPKGEIGFQGKSGNIGPRGMKGKSGDIGDIGQDGIVGKPGIKGGSILMNFKKDELLNISKTLLKIYNETEKSIDFIQVKVDVSNRMKNVLQTVKSLRIDRGTSSNTPLSNCQDFQFKTSDVLPEAVWLDPNEGNPEDSFKGSCKKSEFKYSAETIRPLLTCVRSTFEAGDLLTYLKPYDSETTWQSELRLDGLLLFPPNLRKGYPHVSQLNFLQMRSEYAEQEVEFLCEESIVYADAMENKESFRYATAFQTFDDNYIDLSNGKSVGVGYGYTDKKIYILDSGRTIFNVTVLYDECKFKAPGTFTKMLLSTNKPDMLPIVDFRIKFFNDNGKCMLGANIYPVCFV